MCEISVIIPIYRVEKYINCCVDSILDQTFTDYELILVDDGSPDNCGAICDEYADKDNRIHVIHKENGGLSSARNAGLDFVFNKTESDYIIFVDGDDCLHPQTLEILYDLMTTQKYDIAMCHYEFFRNENECFSEPIVFKSILNKVEVTTGREILEHFSKHERKVSLRSQCMKLYKKSIFIGLRMMEGKTQEDSLVLPYVLERTNSIAKVKLPLYRWRWTEGSISRSGFTKSSFDNIDIYYSDYNFFSLRGLRDSMNYCKKQYLQKTLGYYYKTQNENPELMAYFQKYIKLYRQEYLKVFLVPNLCIRERVAYFLFLFSPELAKHYYNQVYPDIVLK